MSNVTFQEIEVGKLFVYDNELFIKHENQLSTTDKVIGIAWSVKKGKRFKEWCFDLNDEVTPSKLTLR